MPPPPSTPNADQAQLSADGSGPAMGVPHRRIHPAWIVCAVAFLTILGASGFRAAPGLLVKALGAEPAAGGFGWSKAEVSTASFVNLILFGLMGPIAAALMAKYGLRRVVASALVTVSLGALGTTWMHSLWQYIALWGVVVGVGAGCMSTILASNVANRWFVKRKGLVMGGLMAANAAGGLLFLPLLSGLADNQGWRWVSRTIGFSALLMVPLVLLFLKNRPEDVGVLAYGAPADWKSPEPATNPLQLAWSTLQDAWRHGAFWLLAGGFFVCGLSTSGLVQQHFFSAADDHNIGYGPAGKLLLLVGLFDVIGTLGSGWLTDRVDPRKLLFAYYGFRGLSLLILEPALSRGASSPVLIGFMVFYGLDWIATVPPTVALASEIFGTQRGSVVYGWLFAAHQIGGAIFAWTAGLIRDWTASYSLAYLIAAVACFLAASASLRIGRTSKPLGLTNSGPAPANA